MGRSAKSFASKKKRGEDPSAHLPTSIDRRDPCDRCVSMGPAGLFREAEKKGAKPLQCRHKNPSSEVCV